MKHLLIVCITLFLSTAVIAQDKKSPIIHSHAITIHGEPKYPKQFKHFEYAHPNAPKGGTLRIAEVGTFDSVNPYAVKGRPERNTLLLLHGSLLERSHDEVGTMYGHIAQSVEYPASKQWITFHLDPKATFSDGHPITADDVAFTFNTLMKDGSPRYTLYWADVSKVEVVNDQTITFYNNNPSNTELFQILGEIPVLAKHYWQKHDLQKSSLDIPVVSGPYTLSRVDAGRKVVYKRIKNYWAQNTPTRKGMFNFDVIDVTYYKDNNVYLEAFKAGEFDLNTRNTAKNWANAYNIPAVKSGKIIKAEIPNSNTQGFTGLMFNLRNRAFSDPALREAINYAYDFEWTNKNLFYNSYTRSNSYFANSELSATGLPSAKELALLKPLAQHIPERVFTQAYTNPQTNGSGNNRENLKKAKKILQRAGFNIHNGKLINPSTQKPVTLEILQSSALFEGLINPWINNLKKLGIDATLRVVGSAQYINLRNNRNFDASIISTAPTSSPGNEQRDYWGSQAADLNNSWNHMGLSNPAVDALIEHIIDAPNREALVTATRALDRVLLHSHYAVPFHYSPISKVAYWNKFNFITPPKYDYRFFYAPHFWWYDDKKNHNLQH